MNKTIYLKGKKYISAKRAADITGYASDYIGQLCRAKKIPANLVGRSWYVLESEILDHKDKNLLTHKKTLKTRKSKKEVSSLEILKTEKSGLKNKKEETKIEKKSKEKSEPKFEVIASQKDVLFPRKKSLKLNISSIRDVKKVKPIYHNDKKELIAGISNIRDVNKVKSIYYNDEKELFPTLERKLDIGEIKYSAFANIKKVIEESKKRSGFEKFAINASIASLVLLTVGTFIFERDNIGKLSSFNNLGENAKKEISFLYGPYAEKTKVAFTKFKTDLSNTNKNSKNIAASVFSGNTWSLVGGWIKDTAYEMVRPWVEERIFLVEQNFDKTSPMSGSQTTEATQLIAKTVFVASTDKDYVDLKIGEKFEELKNWFLISPIAPNVNRYYVTRQNDTIINNFGSSVSNVSDNLSDFQTSIGLSFSTGALTVSGTSNFTGSSTVADLTATEWLSVGTTTRQDALTLDGAFYIEASSPADTYSRLYNTSGDLYWNGSIIAGTAVGNWSTDGTDVYRTLGNVGIGTTSPYAKLSVVGPVVAEYFHATSTNATSTISGGLNIGNGGLVYDFSTGRVGVATTSPAAGFAVATHCVTGDTRLRRRRKKNLKSGTKTNPLNPPYLNGETEKEEYIYDEVAIKDVEEGDEIQSLDERTGKLVWSKVNKLMYMGEKEIYKITTASGKTIRTTSEHPYFVRGSFSEGRLAKEKISKTFAFIDASNIYYGTKEAGWKIDFEKLKSYLVSRFDVSRIFYFGAINEAEKFDVKLQEELISLGYELMLVTLKKFRNGKKKADTDSRMTFEMMKIKDEYDRAVVLTGDGDFFWVLNYLKEVKEKIWLLGMANRTAGELTKLFGSSFIHLGNVRKTVEKIEKKEKDATFASSSGVLTSYQNTSVFVNDGVWTKVKGIKEGDEIAVTTGTQAVWDKIIKIEKLPAEKVYDIEVEGTHNFVGNDIIAHNTYLGGNLTTEGSTRLDSSLTLSSLSSGGLAVGTGGLVYSAATTTFGTGYSTTTQNYLTFSTTTQSFNGLTLAQNITPTAGALTFTPNVSGTLDNSGLSNSTISGISLGSDLADLTATDTTLTFSGSYNGGTARTVGLNLANSNTWTVNQSFNYSSSTIYSSFATASTTNLVINGQSFNNLLGSGLQNTNNALTLDATGDWTGTLDGFDGFGFPFTSQSWGNATSTTLGFLNGFLSTASSTISSSLYLPSLSQGFAYVGSSGLLNTAASSSLFGFTPITNSLTKGYFIVGDDAGTASATSSIFIDSVGNVGIGTTSPDDKLDIDSGNILLSSSDVARIQLLNAGEDNNGIFFDSKYSGSWKSGDGGSNFGIYKLGNKLKFVYDSGIAAGSTVTWNDGLVMDTAGNVGIGTTSPSAKLSVKGGGTTTGRAFVISDSSDAEKVTVLDNGNVGIGTTNPAQKLSVVGHCMTGETLLAIRRRKRRKNSVFGIPSPSQGEGQFAEGERGGVDYDYLFVQIKDILPGDEVMSLDESSNMVVYKRINALMDMGVREIYEVCTRSGRVIRTTKEHPYLARVKEIQISKSETSTKFEILNVKNKIQNVVQNIAKLVGNSSTNSTANVQFFEIRAKSTPVSSEMAREIQNISDLDSNRNSPSLNLREGWGELFKRKVKSKLFVLLSENSQKNKGYQYNSSSDVKTNHSIVNVIHNNYLSLDNDKLKNNTANKKGVQGEGRGELAQLEGNPLGQGQFKGYPQGGEGTRPAEHCPYCNSKDFSKRGVRKNKNQTVQLYICKNEECGRTFTASDVKGKHFPLRTVIEGMSLYNLGLTLEQTCKILGQKFGVPLPEIDGSKASPAVPTPATLASWINEYKQLCTFSRLREYAIKMFNPKNIIETVTMAHRQLYRFRYHRAKIALMLEEFGNRNLKPLKEYLDNVSSETPHQYFAEGERMSEVRSKFDKTDMIVKAKFNYANKLAAFVLQAVPNNKQRHEELQRFMIANDSVTVATEVPVYIRREDVAHMENVLKFKISDNGKIGIKGGKEIEVPKLLTGHIDFIQIRNGSVHLLDYKPNAEKEKPIEQLTWYALAMSRLTGLRLFEFKCAWFDEKDYFEFYPLHVVKKLQPTKKKKRVYYRSGLVVEIPKTNDLVIIRNRGPDYQDSS